MKAIIKKEASKGLWLDEVPLPQIAGNEVLIKIHKTAICGTDVHIYNWDDWAKKTIQTPLIVGHEFAGEIVEIGRRYRPINRRHRFWGGTYRVWSLSKLLGRSAPSMSKY